MSMTFTLQRSLVVQRRTATTTGTSHVPVYSRATHGPVARTTRITSTQWQ